MRILQVNKFFYVRGGSERYFFELSELLRERGHEVFHFSMQDPRNQASPQQDYFVSNVDLNEASGVKDRVRTALRILYSSEAKSRIGRLIDDLRPDVIHLHNITRQLSASILDAAASRGVPTIQTLHDLSLVCPAHTCFVNGRACEDCIRGAYWHAVPKKCIDGRFTSSLLGAFEAYLHSWLGLYRKIRTFIAPSTFLRTKVSKLSWIGERVVHLPYFVPLGPDYTSANEGYILFAGRITPEKGVGTLIEAASSLRDVRFIVAGEGPSLEDFKRTARERDLSNVIFAGYAEGGDLEALVRGAACVVVPSIWYENLPLSILEAFARGKPVVASDSGGSPELVKDGSTGYVVERGSPRSLVEAIRKILSDEKQRQRMGRQARELVREHYSPDYHYQQIMRVYEDVLG